MIKSLFIANRGRIACSILPELASGRGTARRSRVVEGQARRCFVDDPAKHRIGISKHLNSGNSQRLDAGRTKPGVARLVPLGPISARVRFAVDLERESGIAAEEIEHERSSGMLAAELQPGRTLPQPMPERNFWEGHLATQAPGIACRPRASLWRDVLEHWLDPATMLRMVPLPETSSGRIQ